ncbi:hypothetical protein QUB56_15685 [Microcoleus sp. AR_TQ3_B6]|uniref:hypothetical protein n=1 Tax=Microcoleus sp. AR_TQ3_B6 TaxID=3055284 RepID=UPI002FD14F89
MNADVFILGLSVFLCHFTQSRWATIRSPQFPNRVKVREVKLGRRLLIPLAGLSECKGLKYSGTGQSQFYVLTITTGVAVLLALIIWQF